MEAMSWMPPRLKVKLKRTGLRERDRVSYETVVLKFNSQLYLLKSLHLRALSSSSSRIIDVKIAKMYLSVSVKLTNQTNASDRELFIQRKCTTGSAQLPCINY